jgi:hypothetical protein
MVVVLLGCLGLAAGVAFGTLFSGNEIRASVALPAKASRHHDVFLRLTPSSAHSALCHSLSSLSHIRVHRPKAVKAPLRQGPAVVHWAPSGRLPMGGYVLLGLLAGLSAALGFLVPPRSRLTKR